MKNKPATLLAYALAALVWCVIFYALDWNVAGVASYFLGLILGVAIYGKEES